jgi:UDP-glucose 4-epimerase
MNVAVIGAGGFIGRRLCEHLKLEGCSVAHISSAKPGGIDPGTGGLDPAFELPGDLDAVVYLAQSPYSSRPKNQAHHVLAVNVVSAVQVAEHAARRGVRRFIYTSTGNVYAPSFQARVETDPLSTDSWYALSKVHAEQCLLALPVELDVSILRLFGVYGPGQQGRLIPNLIQRVTNDEPVLLQPGADQTAEPHGLRISLIHVDDIVAVINRGLQVDLPPVMNVASDETYSIFEIASEIGKVFGFEPNFENVDTARSGDLVADISTLKAWYPEFSARRFSNALKEMIRAAGNAVG